MNMAFPDSRGFDAGATVPGLRPLAWSELCARLVAAQDLRRVRALAADPRPVDAAPAPGSFHGAAAHLLEHHGGSQDLINPTSSINRKGRAGNIVDSRDPPAERAPERLADENCDD
jgi:hypothetical protein